MILVDVGNTDTVVARLAGGIAGEGLPAGAPQFLLREPTPDTGSAREELAVRILAARTAAETVAVCSVVPAVTGTLTGAAPDVVAVDHTWDFPFGVAVDEPASVGADRWCNVAAATAAGHGQALVVDAGTATTIDVLADGAFVGGLIAPGMAFAARQLQTRAARLQEVPFAPCPLVPGRDTAAALQAGAYHVGVHGVVGVVQALLATRPDARVVLTGGLGGYLVRPGWKHDPAWTLRGLSVLLRRRRPDAR